MNRLTFMLSVPDVLRTDVAMTEDKTYYRLATDDTIEDGELPGLKGEFEAFTNELLESFGAGVGVSTDIAPLRFTLFVNNVAVRPAVLNRNTLRQFVRKLAGRYDEFRIVESALR